MPDQNSYDVGIETLKKMKALTESAYARTGDDSWRMPWIDKWIIRQLQIAALKEIERKAIETKNHHGNPGTHESQREAKRKEWGGRGYPPALIERGLAWAEEYSIGMAAKITEDQALRHRIIQELYPKSLDMADNWIQGLWKALKPLP